MTDLSVIIITWNSKDEILSCAESVINNSEEIKPELIIIDNNSGDNSFEVSNSLKYSNLHTYKNEKNLGYTKAVNQGIKFSDGKNVLLLNPDTILQKGSLDILTDFLNKNDSYGACAPLLLNPDGTVQQSLRSFPGYWEMFSEFSLLSYIFPKSKLFGRWKMKYFDYSQDADVQQPMAAALMIKRTVLDEVDNMDERFEMFFNDVDLSKKIIDKGYKIRLITEAKIIHEHGVSIHKDRIRMIKIWNRDCVKYFEKHHNNTLGLLWLKINLKISEILRILYYKLFRS
jgi:GT2 family glycosyltransferase